MRSCGIAAQTLMLASQEFGLRQPPDGWLRLRRGGPSDPAAGRSRHCDVRRHRQGVAQLAHPRSGSAAARRGRRATASPWPDPGDVGPRLRRAPSWPDDPPGDDDAEHVGHHVHRFAKAVGGEVCWQISTRDAVVPSSPPATALMRAGQPAQPSSIRAPRSRAVVELVLKEVHHPGTTAMGIIARMKMTTRARGLNSVRMTGGGSLDGHGGRGDRDRAFAAQRWRLRAPAARAGCQVGRPGGGRRAIPHQPAGGILAGQHVRQGCGR